MDVFYTDLDNTLLYSYKHEIGTDKRNVEMYEGREVSFLTTRTYRLLLELKKHVRIVPVTTRTMEQYGRVELGIGALRHALVCNGGMLLVNGRIDRTWYEQSLQLVRESRAELEQAARLLEQEKNRTLDVRDIRQLFVFTKCRFANDTIRRLKQQLQPGRTDVFSNGEKVYVVPKKLNKGMAVTRFTEYIGARHTAAAGDSVFDLPMLAQAEVAMAPAGSGWSGETAHGHIYEMPGKQVFSEELLTFLLKRI